MTAMALGGSLGFGQPANDADPATESVDHTAPPETAGEGTVPSLLDGWAWWKPAPLTEPLVTDRPDFTESPITVPRGHLQLEGGYTFTYNKRAKTRARSHTAPELLLRVGLLDDLEFRVGWEGYAWLNEKAPGETRAGRPVTIEDWTQGASDQYLGFKWHVFDQDGLLPDFALIPAITVPTGSDGFSSGDVDPEVKLAWGYDLSERWALSGNVNFAVPADEGKRFFQTAASVSLAYALLDDVGAYLEYYGFYPNARGVDCAHTLNGGLTWQVTPNFQWDWRIGFGLNEEADDLFTGLGFAIRF